MLGEETASLIECVQQQQDIGRLTISFVDVSGASMDRVCFLVLKHFLKASQVKTMVAHCSRLTLVQFADLLDMLHETSVETLDVSGTDSNSLPVRSLAEFMARSPTLRTLVCDGISLNADDARHFIRGLLKNESIRCLSLNAVADGALGKMVTETELLFRSIRHHKVCVPTLADGHVVPPPAHLIAMLPCRRTWKHWPLPTITCRRRSCSRCCRHCGSRRGSGS